MICCWVVGARMRDKLSMPHGKPVIVVVGH
jgi:hypothetical protein